MKKASWFSRGCTFGIIVTCSVAGWNDRPNLALWMIASGVWWILLRLEGMGE